MENFIYFKSTKDGVPVNHALLNDLHIIQKDFPNKDLSYGLITIDKDDTFGFKTFRKTPGEIKRTLQYDKAKEMCLFWWREYNSFSNPPFVMQKVKMEHETITYLLLAGMVSLDNTEDVEALHSRINFPLVPPPEKAIGLFRERWVFLNDFILRQNYVLTDFSSIGNLEFMVFVINSNKKVERTYLGSNGMNLIVDKTKKFIKAIFYDYAQFSSQKRGGLKRSVIYNDYLADSFEFSDIKLPPNPNLVAESFRKRYDAVMGCSLSFIDNPCENAEGFDEYCEANESNISRRATWDGRSKTIVIDPVDAYEGRMGFSENQEDEILPEDTIVETFDLVTT